HDNEKIFLSMIENGVLGKVYSIFSPLSVELRRKRTETLQQSSRDNFDAGNVSLMTDSSVTQPDIKQSSLPIEKKTPTATNNFSTNGKFNLGEKFSFFKRKKEEPVLEKEEKDVLSLALERSFGEVAAPSRQEPSFGISTNIPETSGNYDIISEPDANPAAEIVLADNNEKTIDAKRTSFSEINSTQQTLNNLRKEWEEMKKAEGSPYAHEDRKPQPTKDEEDIAYPFGGWINEDNYHK
ncbi:MAG: hypothetical protein IJX20_05165, partial [Alphaproteobacteria bacterium]|nr:hypothetical protein [Alphaproteobacteria bacterium]